MSETQVREQDRELRRGLMRQAVERLWSMDLGEAIPTGTFSLPRSRASAPLPTPREYTPVGRPREGSAADLGRRYRSGDLSPVEAAKQALDGAEASQPRLNAFITILRGSAMEAARASEARFKHGQPLGPLDGVPLAVKDLIHMKGVRTTSASKIMADYVATEDAAVITLLQAGGAVIIGKTNLHEFAYGGTGDISYFGPARNPRNPEHITGGSSSGSGAAVGAGVCPIALGTDTACSIRIPAALCGVVGLKATYGRVSSQGVIPLSWSQDHVGPLALTVEDAGLALAAMSDFQMPELRPGSGRLKIGVCRELFFEHLDAEVRQIVERAIAELGEVREVNIPHLAYASAGQSVITAGDAGAFHRHWLDTRPDDYDWNVRNRLEATREASAHDYVQATRLRGLLVDEMAAALAGLDVLAMPTSPVPAPKIGQRLVELEDGTADAIALLIRNNAPMNFTGFPAITVPCRDAANGLPVGLQLVAPPWEEARLLQTAHAAEALFGC
jgi:aspartyl-tRNA(Asn)/glutamyl-tRNA(Gln) amidotransferase subunit A